MFWKTFVVRIKRVDPILFAATSVLSLVSILTLLGGMDNFGRRKFVMQCAMTLAGIVCVYLLANINYRFFVDRLYLFLFVFSVILLGITLIFGNSGANMETSNQSWLKIPGIGISIQPSEFVKITFICTFAKHIETVKEKIRKPLVLLWLLAHALIIIGLILLSGDLGVALGYVGIMAVMLYCAGVPGWYFLIAAGVVCLAFPFLWDFLAPYQQDRILFGFQPHLDPNGYGQQPLMSREAISQGGLIGKGLFTGGIYEKLAASHTDFIFATVCEKFGFVGGFVVVAALVVLTGRLLWLGFRCRDTMGKLICSGIAAIIIVQSLENLWMCLAFVPVVGITLPFVSAGGSSVLALYILMGLAHSVSARERRFYFGELS